MRACSGQALTRGKGMPLRLSANDAHTLQRVSTHCPLHCPGCRSSLPMSYLHPCAPVCVCTVSAFMSALHGYVRVSPPADMYPYGDTPAHLNMILILMCPLCPALCRFVQLPALSALPGMSDLTRGMLNPRPPHPFYCPNIKIIPVLSWAGGRGHQGAGVNTV